ncbi:threonine/serine exporter family protein [Clostridium sp. AM58-1XD]|nr:threonine/serine exporter family protein [Clostridium sp. AM58-1XD]
MILHLVGSFMAVITLSIIFCVPKKYLTCSSLVGALGWFFT